MPRCKEVHLLETRDGFGLNDRVLVILHHRTADQARQPSRRNCIRVSCEQSQLLCRLTAQR